MKKHHHIQYSGDSVTKNDIIEKIKDEIKSLMALSIVNIIFGSFAIAIGVSTSVSNFNLLKESFQIALIPIISLCFGIGIGIVGLYWLISSANIVDFADDIQRVFNTKNTQITEESMTSLIIKMIAFYRKNSKMIQQMILMSLIGGVLFIGYTIFLAFTLLLESSESALWVQSIQIIELVLMVLVGIACFIIPRFFKKYACVWDGRIKEAENVETTLQEQLRSH